MLLCERDVNAVAQALRSCARFRALQEGRRIHEHARKVGLSRLVYVANSLIFMYGKCGSLDEARDVFCGIPDSSKNVFTWTTMLGLYARRGHSKQALDLFHQMLARRIKPEDITFVAVLNACCRPEFLQQGRELHSQLCSFGYDRDVIVATALISMYSKCGSIAESESMFRSMNTTNIVSWNAHLAAYAEHGLAAEADCALRKMQLEGIEGEDLTYISIMRAFRHPSHLRYARRVHRLILEAGIEQDVAVGTTLVHMYSKCSSLEDVKKAFRSLREPNLVTWNVLVAAHVQHGELREAVVLFRRMQLLGMQLDNVTYINVLGACCCPSDLEPGKFVHACVVEAGFASNLMIQSVLLNMYAKCGSLEDAEAIFGGMAEPTLVSWNTMIGAYAQNGHSYKALQTYRQMRDTNVTPDTFTFVSVLDACATSGALVQGRLIHQELGDTFDVSVGNALINMYGKCGKVQMAREVFDRIPKVTLSWNSILATYSQHGHSDEVFELYPLMQLEGFEPTYVTFISLITACANKGLLEKGHGYFVSMQMDFGVPVSHEHYGCMLDLLGKAGRLREAERLINEMPYEPDFVSWTSFLGACRNHGDYKRSRTAVKGAIEIDPDCATSYLSVSNIYEDEGYMEADSGI